MVMQTKLKGYLEDNCKLSGIIRRHPFKSCLWCKKLVNYIRMSYKIEKELNDFQVASYTKHTGFQYTRR